VADEVSRQHQDGDHGALVGHVEAQTVGENAVAGLPGGTLHQVGLPLLHAQGQSGEAVGNQVDPQQVDGLQNDEAQQGGDKDAEHLAHVGAQQELDGLADVVVDPAALLNGAHDGGEVVVGQHHVGHVLGHVGAGDAHAHADVGGLDGGGVVDAVAGHGGDAAPLLPGVDDAHLVLGLHPGVDAVVVDGLIQLLVADLVELSAGDGLVVVLQDAQLLGDGHGGVPVVAGDHHGADAGGLALGDGGLHLGADGVDHARQPQEGQVVLQGRRGLILGHLVIAALRGGQHTEGLIGHGLVLGQNLRLGPLVQGEDLAVLLIVGAALQKFVGSALGVLHIALLQLVDGGHHLPAGVKGGLAHTGGLPLHGGLAQALLGGPVYQSALSGLAHRIARLIGGGVGAQGHGPCGF